MAIVIENYHVHVNATYGGTKVCANYALQSDTLADAVDSVTRLVESQNPDGFEVISATEVKTSE